jgi:type I restriction enzyme, S subunit
MSLAQYERYRQSGAEWLGSIPEHWSAARIKTIFEIRKRIAGELGHDVLSVTQRGLKVRNTDSNDGQLSMDYSKYQLVEPDDFVMNHMDLLTGYVDVSKFSGVTSPDYRVFTARKKELSLRFFLYLFQNGYKQRIFYAFGQGASGLGRWRMPTDSFNDFILPVPPLLEQIAIAYFLDRETEKIDVLVEEQERLIELLKEKRQAVISHAVNKGLDPNVPMKASGVEWLGEMPEHWACRSISSICTKITNGYVGPTRDILVDEGVRYLQSLHIKGNRIRFDSPYFVRHEWSVEHSKSILNAGDVLIVQTGDIGQVAVVTDEFVGCNCHALIIVSPVKTVLSGEWLSWTLNSDYGLHSLLSIQTGALHPHLNCGNVKSLMVPVPPLAEQKEIVATLSRRLTEFDGLISEAQMGISLLQERRAGLISAAVTGKIDVRGLVTNTLVNADSKNVRLVVAAEIIERLSQKANFGRVKFQKLIYLTEAHAGVSELDGNYLRAAAGPLDRDMIAEMEAQLQRAGHTSVDQPGGQGKQVIYKFHGNAGAYRKELTTILAERKPRFLSLIDDLGGLETKSVEAVATLFAVWNDALIDGHTPTDDAVVSGVLEEWHPDKTKKFRAAELHEWLGWMRRHNLVPEGKGPRTSTGRLFL